MNNRVAIVTGAGGALGRATSKILADSGFTVVAVDRKEQALRELPDGIRFEVADATDPAVPRPLMDRIASVAGLPRCSSTPLARSSLVTYSPSRQRPSVA